MAAAAAAAEDLNTERSKDKELIVSPVANASVRLFSPPVPNVPADLKVGIIPTDPAQRQRWIRAVKVENPTARMLCFTNFGSSAAIYRNWHKFASADIEIVALESPGAGSLRSIEPYANMADLDHCVSATFDDPRFDLLKAPMCAYAQCIQGAFCANIMVDVLSRMGRKPLHLFIGAAIPPHFPLPNFTEPEVLRKIFRLPKALVAKYPLMFKLATNSFPDYIKQAAMGEHPHDVPITVFRGKRDPFITEDQSRQWARYTTGEFTYVEVPDAEHVFQHKDESAKFVMDYINAKLSTLTKHRKTLDTLGNAFGFPSPTQLEGTPSVAAQSPPTTVRYGCGEIVK
eukprot:TRINITY_DN4032_c0_g1_i1.p1 TRINITY_DN4032_c0_g1~~TRINITY_DN4032_c0_g1_i1.p1  ORF type:complete len:365 (+),score=86.76 TRINITY_DN4032_c0_g1_i1:69-1097(+)